MTTRTQSSITHHASPGAVRAFSMLNGLVLLGILLQGVWAGGLVGDLGGAWRVLHGVTAGLVVILALAAAAVAVIRLRGEHGLVPWSIALFVLLIIQSGLGAATRSASALFLIHVPNAMLIMGLGVYLSVAASRARRSVSARPSL
ncbi:MAG TPA: hypothetical protein VH589_06505 [Trebonia sp.]|jgi:hypothetical protein